MTEQNKQETAAVRQNIAEQQSQKKTRDLNALSRRSLWQVLLFILISIVAVQLREFNLLQMVPESVRAFLGSPPPAYLVTAALAVYSLSVLTIILTQISNDAEPNLRWSHLGYRTAFYFFYAFSGTLMNHFMAVFYVGLLLYGVEQVHIWMHNNRVAHQDKELLGER